MNEGEFWKGASPDGRARYRDATIIGQGAYSVVARATDTATGTTVAIKRISEVFYDAHEAKKVLREIRLLRDFEHPNIISLKALVPPTSMETFNDMFMCKGGHPPLLKMHLGKKLSVETLMILDMVLGFTKAWDKELDDPIWNPLSLKIKKYKPFVSLSVSSYREMLKRKFT